MTDYKELITEIRNCFPTNLERRAADAIERLVKERDALIEEIIKYGNNCKNCIHGSNGKNDCLDDRYAPCKWEWRGIKEAEHEAD